MDEFAPNTAAQQVPQVFAVRRELCLSRTGPKPFTRNGEAS